MGGKVLHISVSPLSGAPGNLSNALNKFSNFSSQSVILGNPGNELLSRRQSSNSLFIPSLQERGQGRHLLSLLLKQSDIVHVHNSVSEEAVQLIYDMGLENKIKFIYQMHSPSGEPPFWSAFDEYIPLEFSTKLAVAHSQPRMNPDFKMVPNIVFPMQNLVEHTAWDFGEIISNFPTVSFAPSSKSNFRWGNKNFSAVSSLLKKLEIEGLIRANIIQGWGNLEARHLLMGSDIVIDDTITGAFHNLSMEALSIGAAVINGSDFISDAISRTVYASPAPPPFIRVVPDELAGVLRSLIRDKEKLVHIGKLSKEYYDSYVHPEMTISSYVKVYEESC